jgi:diaminohydroxyphosphoribosylaminopyrimidine deaminase/5-amino-6-(5-phosphoribosylamino)uracil reductase
VTDAVTGIGAEPAIDPLLDAAMRRALFLAERGPVTGADPRVGCVVLSAGGEILGEGWHRGAGHDHAEVDALAHVPEGAARGATVVVTLEPCAHGAGGEACTDALVAAGVARVVYAVDDPGAHSGGGARRLREAGLEVEGGLLGEEAAALLHVWLTAERRGLPFVTLKWASSLDGRIAAADGTSQWITGTASRQRVHEQRAAVDAIAVGTGTVLADDPSLTARGEAGELMPHQPIPVVIGERSVPRGAKLLAHPQQVIETGSRDLVAILTVLFRRGVRHLFVEGGPTLATAFIDADLVDEFSIDLAPMLIGGPFLAVGGIGVSTLGEAKRLVVERVEQLGPDVLVTARPGWVRDTARAGIRSESASLSGPLTLPADPADGHPGSTDAGPVDDTPAVGHSSAIHLDRSAP